MMRNFSILFLVLWGVGSLQAAERGAGADFDPCIFFKDIAENENKLREAQLRAWFEMLKGDTSSKKALPQGKKEDGAADRAEAQRVRAAWQAGEAKRRAEWEAAEEERQEKEQKRREQEERRMAARR